MFISDWKCKDFLKVVKGRYQLRATTIASQSPIGEWHPNISDTTLADAKGATDYALLSGSIDFLKREGNENDNILEIIDFKTGNERKLEEQLRLQAQLYTAAAREALALNVKKAFVHFLDTKKQQRVEI